jgi:hypothetical protein
MAITNRITERFLPVELADLESRHVVQMVEAVLQKQYPAAI